MEHVRAAAQEVRPGKGFCLRGVQAFAKRHGFDFQDFCRNGVEADALEATGDHFALKVVEYARRG